MSTPTGEQLKARFLAAIVARGWFEWHHENRRARSAVGMPDLEFCQPGRRKVELEFKGQTEHLRPEQKRWWEQAGALTSETGPYYAAIVRPDNAAEVARVLGLNRLAAELAGEAEPLPRYKVATSAVLAKAEADGYGERARQRIAAALEKEATHV